VQQVGKRRDPARAKTMSPGTEKRLQTPPDAGETARLLHLATTASVATAAVLIVAKLGAWLATGSVSVLASLIDSVMDAGASLVNLVAVRWSLQPPDAEHRFGHGNAQALAALGQAVLIAGSAVYLVFEAIDRLRHPEPLAAIGVGLAVIGIAIAATLVLLAIQRHVIRRTDSHAIRADSLHYATDLATNVATLLALLLAASGVPGADPVFGLGIGAYILYSAGRIGYDAAQPLLDRELPDDDRRRIVSLARAVPMVRGVHGLRTRRSGQTRIIQLHLELDDDLPLVAGHDVALEVEQRIRGAFPDSDILIHQDPVSARD
jgi:ferrous-iron efflux pump FieF